MTRYNISEEDSVKIDNSIFSISNDKIKNNEIKLIRSILPQYNEAIPDKIDIQESVPAFNH